VEHCEELEPEGGVLECRACGGAKVFSSREKDCCSEGHTTFDLQCGESLAIAANHIGEGAGIKQLLSALARAHWAVRRASSGVS
jgi:hypothetical protein